MHPFRDLAAGTGSLEEAMINILFLHGRNAGLVLAYSGPYTSNALPPGKAQLPHCPIPAKPPGV